MIFNTAIYSEGGGGSASFEFTYSGSFTDETVDGVRTISFTSSGTLTVIAAPSEVNVYVLGGGAGGHRVSYTPYRDYCAGGASGGFTTVPIHIEPGDYPIVIGAGGPPYTTKYGWNANRTQDAQYTGGTSSAFGIIATGGLIARYSDTNATVMSQGAAGLPNGVLGTINNSNSVSAAGASPNGGSVVDSVAYAGGAGVVRISYEV